MQVGTDFLVRLWIRRPETKPLTEKELHRELDVPEDVSINTQEVETDIKFEPIQGRKLRRGEVEVQLSSPRCEITPHSIKLFVDEDLDAPAAIFTLRAKQIGPVSLFFSVWQDGGQLISITHNIQVIASSSLIQESIRRGSYAIPLGDVMAEGVQSDEDDIRNLIKKYHRNLQILKQQQASFGPLHTPPYILTEIEDIEAEIENLKKELEELDAETPTLYHSQPAQLSGPAHDAVTPSRYELKEKLGQGAGGIIYIAFDNVLVRTVAIKLLSGSETLSTTDEHSHLLREVRIASQLQHPHIAAIYDVTEVNDQICLVMEHLEGQTLASYLQKEKQLPLREVIALVEQAADALDYAHKQGVIHGDIKPANLVITPNGGLKLTDFNFDNAEQDGIKGTLVYMSPEQIIGEERLDGRSDLFSLATVTFEMLSGKLPWSGSTFPQIITNITSSAPLSLANFNVPDADLLDPIFYKALAKNPDERYQQGLDFVKTLKRVVR